MNIYKKISIVLPVYNEEETIHEAIDELLTFIQVQKEYYELIFVDDGSKDNSVAIIEQAIKEHPEIKLVQFSRNFGHQLAISCGIRYATGDAVVVMDADLQDPPEVVYSMVQKWKEGYEVVYGKRASREGETIFKKETAKAFYRVLRRITDVEIPVDTGDFRLMDRHVVDVLKRMNETHPYVRGLVSWSGFKQTYVEYERHERFAGSSKYSLKKMFGLAMDGITSFSTFPLKIANYIGGGFLAIAILYLIIAPFLINWKVENLLVFLLLFVTGTVLVILGLMGTYLGRVFEESRNRPLFIVSRTEGFKKTTTFASKVK